MEHPAPKRGDGSGLNGLQRVGDAPKPRVKCQMCRTAEAFSGDLCAACRVKLTLDFVATIDEELLTEYRRILNHQEPEFLAGERPQSKRMFARRRMD